MKTTAAIGAAMVPLSSILARRAFGLTPQGAPLAGAKIPQFVDPLPNLLVLGDPGNPATSVELQMLEFPSRVMPTGFAPAVGPYTGTWVWGYRTPNQASTGQVSDYPYIGPVIVAKRGVATEMKYVNMLGKADAAAGQGSQIGAWVQSTDQTLHWANPKRATMMDKSNYYGPIPAVPHLHGGEVPPQLDGGPDAWFLSDVADSAVQDSQGHAFYSMGWDGSTRQNYCIYRYPNTQEAANIWFHDHALGITRLNVYAGLAGGYILTDPDAGIPTNLPALIPLVIQDRMFDVNGQLFFPNLGINPEHPFWIPEFVGDTIVVNGKVWPYKAVDRQRYRMLFLNGSSARAYDMSLIHRASGVRGPRMWVIGTDGGYLDAPVLIDPNSTNKAVAKSLTIMPGERYEVIVDFNDPVWTGLLTAAGVPFPLNLELRNTAKTPFPGGAPATANTTGRIIQFRVSNTVPAAGGDQSYDPATGGPLRPTAKQIVRLVNPALGTQAVTPNVKRQLTLNEVMGPGGPLEVLVNNTKWAGHSVHMDVGTVNGVTFDANGVRSDFTPGPGGTYYSELPNEGDTELWEIINLTADAHPIHLHLVQFQLMNRQGFDVMGYNAAYNALFPASNTALDPMTMMPYPGGMYIGGYGPPSNYKTLNADSAVGGNPAVSGFLNAKKWPVMPPLPSESGWKDTVIMYPGQVTRIMVRWAPTDVASGDTTNNHFPFDPNGGHGFVWHCHIIDHEDNEMMRPDLVQPKTGVTRTYVKGTDY